MTKRTNKLVKNILGVSDWSLDNLLYIKLKEINDMESRLVKAIPQMAKKAHDSKLKKLFEDHLEETKQQVERIEKSFESLGKKSGKIQGATIRGLELDAKLKMTAINNRDALDASLIAAGENVEHYEMSCYITAIEWSELIGADDIAELLMASLKEETDMELKLLNLSKSIYTKVKV